MQANPKKIPSTLMTREQLFNEARKYSTRTEFKKIASGIFLTCQTTHKDILDNVFPDSIRRPSWTEESIRKEAAKYSSKIEFMNGSGAACQAAYKRFPGLVDELFENLRKPNNYWTRERIEVEIQKYKTRTEFSENASGAFNVCDKYHKDLIDKYLGKRNRWIEETIREESKKYNSKRELELNCYAAYDAAIKRYPGLLDELFGESVHWTKNQIIERAKGYATKQEFRKGDPAAYVACQSKKFRGLINDLFDNQNEYWDKDKIIATAKQYKSKMEFRRAHTGAYMAAVKRFPGLLNELFGNQITHGTRDCVYIWFAEADIYKVGITSSAIGDKRIKNLSKKYGFSNYELIRLLKVNNARKLETQILKIGKRVHFDNKIDGYREFRKFSISDLNEALALIDNSIIFD